ncbi:MULTISPECIES: hypothetical protein [Flammeovirga]|uniref:Uncharacterized protein n=1 Tax=Flammeovirga agarivorans TaxID=2726742 RepID=A0A7X8SP75_9BACT|nr:MULTISPECIES: hypothetical protein [Flammeovirga]NLR93819.1 hypothetical protein [Flammeovirga agarivorans]
MLLKREECKQAILKWEKTKTDFEKIRALIDATKVFRFDESDQSWIREHNKNHSFHVYAGVHNDHFVLIIVPLTKKGKEKALEKYLTKTLTALKKDITLVETEVVTTVTKTKLSADLAVTKFWKEVNLPVHNEPTITEKASAYDIEKWKNESLNWFFYEYSTSRGRNIFRTFTVPLSDLDRDDNKKGDVIAFFGLKLSPIYQKQIPILIFVSQSEKDSGTGEILRAKLGFSAAPTNSQDWSQPCPPLCKDKSGFTLF